MACTAQELISIWLFELGWLCSISCM